ncbi:5-methyltetrahydropteroyltriglutamate--homocysteine S-methyltransferase [Winogradskya consettensis]|uniref:5-methyltetrahydropteroyltriglutamate--homocystei ne S-methyltransferase n=1 Tax=Winogradskya consettensis TaxID=113560 RepID=A0A919VJE6_9ACTN|nr:cobalamin-independent methionine synthase II family protein [Actinoplanes consettensis]GIM68226.1 5-methyltetrahydropteroyltriglutamate--homocystei ne S-methyltransferase [Actinoplanes consettensis]
MSNQRTAPTRATHVGSLLRPAELLRARQDHAAGRIDAQTLTAAEDTAIQVILDVQRDSGIGPYTDGEYRRNDFMSQLTGGTDGFVAQAPTLDWNAAGDERHPDDAILNLIGGKLLHRDRFAEREATFLARHAPGPFKVTIPEVTNFVVANWQAGVSDEAYPTRADLVDDLAAVLQSEVEALVRDGVRHIQIDAPCFTSFVNDKLIAVFEAEGLDPRDLLRRCVEADARIVAGLREQGVTVGMHICRGNYRGQWFNEGTYDGIAEDVFGGIPVDHWLLEYDTDRAGSFAPIRHVPAGTTVVLGLVTTKTGALENPDDLVRRIDEASRHLPLDALALSPQCGFASEVQGNPLTWDDQRRKLDLVVSTAQRVWG